MSALPPFRSINSGNGTAATVSTMSSFPSLDRISRQQKGTTVADRRRAAFYGYDDDVRCDQRTPPRVGMGTSRRQPPAAAGTGSGTGSVSYFLATTTRATPDAYENAPPLTKLIPIPPNLNTLRGGGTILHKSYRGRRTTTATNTADFKD